MFRPGENRNEELSAITQAAIALLSVRLAELAVASSAADRTAMLRNIRDIIAELRRELQSWSATYFATSAIELGNAISDDVRIELPVASAGARATARFMQETNKALTSIDALATRFANIRLFNSDESRTDPTLVVLLGLTLASNTSLASVRTQLQDGVRKRLVSVLGSNGRLFRFDLEYYESLVAQQKEGEMQKAISISAARAKGTDLVRVSTNASTIGDYCDLYRGKVFSISGTDPDFPPLSLAPNGGTPFHPWCHHTLSPFDDSGITDKERQELADIPETFRELGLQQASPAQFMKAWSRLKKSGGSASA